MNSSQIRNFVIIAHIDHGKSTLADRFLELTGTVEARKMRAQFLDQMDLEQEKGITIKMQPVRMVWEPNRAQTQGAKREIPNDFEHQNLKPALEIGDPDPKIPDPKQMHVLNLIDTPGHADFGYEVSRALAAVEGAILLVDATQGVQAQTLANLNLARAQGLAIIPAINKIDLPNARTGECRTELADLLGCPADDVFLVSAKTGAGVAELLEAIVRLIPPPGRGKFKDSSGNDGGRFRGGRADEPGDGFSRALIFDSHFDAYRGIIAHVRVFEGIFSRAARIQMLATRKEAEIIELGHFLPALQKTDRLGAGEIGYIATGIKEPDAVRVGDTIAAGFRDFNGEPEPLPGYREPKPVVFASVFPEDPDEYEKLRDALGKMRLNDSSFVYEPELFDALGRGFRLGFLGMLHMEILGERLRREYGIRLIFVTPSVAYRIRRKHGRTETIYSAARIPDEGDVEEISEPWVRMEVIVPERFFGNAMALLSKMRGAYVNRDFLGSRTVIRYEAPLADILVEFFDDLKSESQGYGSFSYEMLEYRPGDLARLDILIAGEREEALTRVVPRERAYVEGRALVGKIKGLLPKQLFAVSVQAAVGSRILARETIPAMKKDVTGYLYGGDRTRKMKLWKKQQRGKKRLRAEGRVEVPPDVFLKLLKRQ